MSLWRTFIADVPWLYDDVGIRGGTKRHYAGVPLKKLCAMPVAALAEKSAHLYFWTTNSFLIDGSAAMVVKSWDFEPKQLLTWCKSRIGTGHHFRNTTEHVIFATRGDKVRGSASLPTHFWWPLSEHSEKPVEFARQVVEKMSPGPYLELFARQRLIGWDGWGNQCKGGQILPALDEALR